MTLATRTVTLPGGLQATLVHQPQADRAHQRDSEHAEPGQRPAGGEQETADRQPGTL